MAIYSSRRGQACSMGYTHPIYYSAQMRKYSYKGRGGVILYHIREGGQLPSLILVRMRYGVLLNVHVNSMNMDVLW